MRILLTTVVFCVWLNKQISQCQNSVVLERIYLFVYTVSDSSTNDFAVCSCHSGEVLAAQVFKIYQANSILISVISLRNGSVWLTFIIAGEDRRFCLLFTFLR